MSDEFNLLTGSPDFQLYSDATLACSLEELYNLGVEPLKEEPVFDEHFEQQFSKELNQNQPVAQYPLVPSVPCLPPGVISNEEYPGPYNFEVFVDPHNTNKTPWVYSSTLNKVFISMLSVFPVDFKWTPVDKSLFVRATPLFSLPSHAQEFVTRCIPHALGTDSANIDVPKNVWDHVIRCQNANADYQGDFNIGLHLSVVVPLGRPQSGTDSVRHMFRFMCKNSCPSGMNRKPLEVVFTLEDEQANVLGRNKVSVRVCSCPKRDKEKEEKEYMKQANEHPEQPPHGKKRKGDKIEKKISIPTSELDTKEYNVNLKICGKQNYMAVLKYAHDLMGGEILSHGLEQPFKKYANDIAQLMKNPPE